MTYKADDEAQIINLKYAAPRIGTLDDATTVKWSKALLLKIHVITGWVIPSAELLNILVDQFGKKLKEDYPDFNTEEIEYAFRKRGTTTKDWGKEMNLGLIDEILVPYLAERLRASETEEQMKRKDPEPRVYTEEEILNERRGDIEMAYQCMRKGGKPMLYSYFKEILIMDGFIKNDGMVEDESDIEAFFAIKIENGVPALYKKE